MSNLRRVRNSENLFMNAVADLRSGRGIQNCLPCLDTAIQNMRIGPVDAVPAPALFGELKPSQAGPPIDKPQIGTSKTGDLADRSNGSSGGEEAPSNSFLTSGATIEPSLSNTCIVENSGSAPEVHSDFPGSKSAIAVTLSYRSKLEPDLKTMFLDRQYVLNALISADDGYPYLYHQLQSNEPIATGKFFGMSFYELLVCGYGNTIDRLRLYSILRSHDLIEEPDLLSDGQKMNLRLQLSFGMKYVIALHAADRLTYLMMIDEGTVPKGDFFGMSTQEIVKSGYGKEDDKEAMCALISTSTEDVQKSTILCREDLEETI